MLCKLFFKTLFKHFFLVYSFVIIQAKNNYKRVAINNYYNNSKKMCKLDFSVSSYFYFLIAAKAVEDDEALQFLGGKHFCFQIFLSFLIILLQKLNFV